MPGHPRVWNSRSLRTSPAEAVAGLPGQRGDEMPGLPERLSPAVDADALVDVDTASDLEPVSGVLTRPPRA